MIIFWPLSYLLWFLFTDSAGLKFCECPGKEFNPRALLEHSTVGKKCSLLLWLQLPARVEKSHCLNSLKLQGKAAKDSHKGSGRLWWSLYCSFFLFNIYNFFFFLRDRERVVSHWLVPFPKCPQCWSWECSAGLLHGWQRLNPLLAPAGFPGFTSGIGN